MLKILNVCQKTREIINQEYNPVLRQMENVMTRIDTPIENYHSKYSKLKEKYPNVNFYY